MSDIKSIIKSIFTGDFNTAKKETSSVLYQKAGYRLETAKEQIAADYSHSNETNVIDTAGEEPQE